MATATGFSWTASYNPATGQGYAGFKSDMPATQTFVFGTTGGSVTNAPNLRITGSSTPTITTASWFNILDFTAAQTFTLPATSLNLNSLIPAYAYNTVVLTGLTANMRGPGFLLASGASSIGPLVINNTGTTQLISLYPAPTYGAGTFYCTTLTITAGNFDGGVQKFTGSCTAGVLTTTGSPTLVPGSILYDSVGVPYGYSGSVVSGSSNTWVLGDLTTSFASKDLWVGGSESYLNPSYLTCSGAVTWTGGTLTNFGSTTAYIYGDGKNSITWTCTTFTINGPTFNHTLQNGGTINPSTSFVLTSGSYTYNGGVLGAVPLFTHTAGTATFNYSYSLTTTGTYTLTAGTLTLANGVTLDTGIFSSSGAGTRAIGFGASITSGSVALDGSSQYLTVPSSTQLTFGTGDYTVETWVKWTTLTTSAIFDSESINGFNLYYDTGSFLANYLVVSNRLVNQITYNWIPSVNTWYHIAISRSGTNAQMFINGILVATNAADTTNYATSSYRIGSDVSAGWYLNGNISNLRVVKGVGVYTGNFTVPTSPLTATQSSGTNISAITGTQTSLLLNTVKGAGFLTDSSTYNTTVTNNNAATSSILSPFVGVVNLTHTTAATVVLNMAAAGGFSWSGSGGFTVAAMANTRTFSVANTSGGSTTTAPNLYFTTGASIATLTTGSWFNSLDFGTTSFTLGTTSLNIDGDLTLSSSGTYTGLTVSILGTSTVTTNGKTIVALTIGSATLVGTATLAGTVTLSGALNLTQGSLTCSTYNVQSATFASTGALTRSITGSGTYTITGAGATAFSNASATGITITGLIISMTAATAKTFAGGGGLYPTLNQGGAGALTISGNNSFGDLTATTRPSTITFTISTTQTFTDFTLSGTAGNLVTINSSSAGTQASLSKTSGTVSVGYLSIRDSNATGGANWSAGNTSVNVSNNTGWIFSGYVFTAGGDFFAFF